MADGGVSVGVHRPQRSLGEAPDEIAAASLETTPHEDKLVVPRTQAGMVRIDEQEEVVAVLALEVLNRQGLLL